MAGQIAVTPGVNVTPSAEKVALSSNYITNFDFLKTELPEVYEKQFERYGNRTISSFLRMVGAESPMASDKLMWTEQGRLHIKYENCTTTAVATDNTATIVVPGGNPNMAVRPQQTVMITGANGANKAIVTSVDAGANSFDVAYYEVAGQAYGADTDLTVFIYGSEFKKGTNGMVGSLESTPEIFSNKPIILKDNYEVSGSDMAQIGWVEVTTEDGGSGFLWYMQSEHETRLRYEDYLETSMIEAVPMDNVANAAVADGAEGVFYVVGSRGNVWDGGNPSTLTEFDTIIGRLDKQGAIEENALFINRDFGFDIDDMLAGLNGYNASGASNAASFGLFDNDAEMALNLGFSGFRRGYDFYKTDWKYLNDPMMRGGLANGGINGLMVPAGTKTVYDQILGKNIKRPFLHVRYRASKAENRKLKSWITGSAGGAATSDLDAMQVNFLSERTICTLGANNFFLFED